MIDEVIAHMFRFQLSDWLKCFINDLFDYLKLFFCLFVYLFVLPVTTEDFMTMIYANSFDCTEVDSARVTSQIPITGNQQTVMILENF